ncbi:putative polyketide synthase protein [Botrytis fragariae]|uniref:Putative polyketide synthase protein n=1 Tax=Botrytis fragariae TaxID=1964551 RepID=A0A8H6AQX8_9HELO|nr:putative polyketide synthase protein [Botrytis fragariae]KAF5872004.1 putative polyketide synthase protein [Botrytis fragariae]
MYIIPEVCFGRQTGPVEPVPLLTNLVKYYIDLLYQFYSLDSPWDLLANGGEAWSTVPAGRFNEIASYHPDLNDPNGKNKHRGGYFIDGDVRDFDHAFFHISQPVAAAMDPQQRILLELVYEAFESAGWRREECAGSRTAVFAASFGMDYERNLFKDILNLPVYQSHGTRTAILANRISHIFDLHSTSVTIDTGCSGGLVAFHQACQSLRKNESNATVVAAANLQLMSDHYISMSNQYMININGRFYPFDNRGDCYGRSEGFVVVVLKCLSDALRDRDPTQSIVLNSAINQDGYTASGIIQIVLPKLA